MAQPPITATVITAMPVHGAHAKPPVSVKSYPWIGEVGETYEMYVALHHAYHNAPSAFPLARCNAILTAIMGGRKWGWRVVGIIRAALSQLVGNEFGLPKGHGITRAHRVPRIETAKILLSGYRPLPIDEFVQIWVENDQTVLCARGENKKEIPDFIAIENDDAELFSSSSVVGWKHSKQEKSFLKEMARKLSVEKA